MVLLGSVLLLWFADSGGLCRGAVDQAGLDFAKQQRAATAMIGLLLSNQLAELLTQSGITIQHSAD